MNAILFACCQEVVVSSFCTRSLFLFLPLWCSSLLLLTRFVDWVSCGADPYVPNFFPVLGVLLFRLLFASDRIRSAYFFFGGIEINLEFVSPEPSLPPLRPFFFSLLRVSCLWTVFLLAALFFSGCLYTFPFYAGLGRIM